MRMLSEIFFLCFLALSDETINQNYKNGLTAFQESKYDLAKEQLMLALAEEPENPLINYNLGLTEHKLGKFGRALAMWRRAQTFSPDMSEAFTAEQFLLSQVKVKALPHQITMYESLREGFLKTTHVNSILIISAILLLGLGWSLIILLTKRKRPEIEHRPSSSAYVIPFLFGAFLILSLIGFGLKVRDSLLLRGTIIAEKVDARSSPGLDQATMFELFEGLEVIATNSTTDTTSTIWWFVTYPGGLSG